MIEFVICDDNHFFIKKTKEIINSLMMNNKNDYEIRSYDDYNNEFINNEINCTNDIKIYILDIETPTNNGIEIARLIRKKDIDSYIIFLTSHEELGKYALKKDLFFQAFINKEGEFEDRITNVLNKILNYKYKKNAIVIETKSVTYYFKLAEILYIEKDSVNRKSIIHTEKGEYSINKNINELLDMLDERFIQTHRSCIVNKDRIWLIDKKNNIITFDNNKKIYLLSSIYKKGLEK